MLEKYYIPKKDYTDLNVYRCGFEECLPHHTWGPGVRDHYIVHIILSGKGTYSTNGNTEHLEAGQGFLICPGQIVRYEADGILPWTYSWVGFHGLKAESVLKKAGLTCQNPVFTFGEGKDGKLIVESLNTMIEALRKGNAPELMLTGYLYLFLNNLILNQRNNTPVQNKSKSTDHYVMNAIEYIEKNYAGTLSVEDLAKNFQIDRSYLSTLFSKHLGIPPREFIIQFRMDKACELLKNPQLNIGDVSRSVGYEDPLQFSKIFKKTKGDSPSEYRKKLLNS